MLRLTKKADYSLIALKHFAAMRAVAGSAAAPALSAKELAESSGIPLPLLSKLSAETWEDGLPRFGVWNEWWLPSGAQPARYFGAGSHSRY